jgi:hypothetical protein
MSAPDVFALGGRQDDAELYALLAEHRHMMARAGELADAAQGDEHSALYKQAEEIWSATCPLEDRISECQPKTLRGVLAALDFAAVQEDYTYSPEGAVEGLRAIVERQEGGGA